MFLGLALGNSFGTWEGNFAVVSLGPLAGLMIVTGEVSLVGLSLTLPLGTPLESTNPGSELSDTLLGAPLGLRFLSDAVRCMCC